MTRLIDADDLMDWSEIVPLTDDGGIDINDFEEKLKSMPTIDIEPVRHGKWEETDNSHCTCSACGAEWNVFENDTEWFNFCPNCGAKMLNDTALTKDSRKAIDEEIERAWEYAETD